MTGGGCVAVTGGTGFLGPYVVAALAEAGWKVRLLVRPGRTRVLPDGVEVVEGDMASPGALRRLLDGVDVLVHAAGAIKARTRDDFLAVNRDGARLLAAAAAAERPDMRVVVVSSLAARQPELSDYAFSKAAGEQAFRDSPLTDVVVLRPAAIYGPGDRETGSWLAAAFGPVLPVPRNPGARVCLIHAADVAAAVVACCQAATVAGPYELSDARIDGYGWPELAEAAIAAAGGHARIVNVPASVLHFLGRGAHLVARLTGRPTMLGPGKVREIMHADWGSDAARQPPPALWRPRWDLAAGLAHTFSDLRRLARDARNGVSCGDHGETARQARGK